MQTLVTLILGIIAFMLMQLYGMSSLRFWMLLSLMNLFTEEVVKLYQLLGE